MGETPHRRPCYLLELPAEIRSQIFSHLFHDARVWFDQSLVTDPEEDIINPMYKPGKVEFTLHQLNTHIAILKTCRQLHSETTPMFWSSFEFYIPPSMLWCYRHVGLWTHPDLSRMLSLRPQIQNFFICFRGSNAYGDAISCLSEITCFTSDFKYYSNLKRCTLVNVCEWTSWRRYGHPVSNEVRYNRPEDAVRFHLWEDVNVMQNLYNSVKEWRENEWLDIWVPVTKVLLVRRSDPHITGCFDGDLPTEIEADAAAQTATSNNTDGGFTTSEGNVPMAQVMSFRIFFNFIMRYTYPRDSPEDLKGCSSKKGQVVPLGFEAEFTGQDEEHPHVPIYKDVRMTDLHHAAERESNPSGHSIDVCKVRDLETLFPFMH